MAIYLIMVVVRNAENDNSFLVMSFPSADGHDCLAYHIELLAENNLLNMNCFNS